jgi:hypothetical protein
VWLAADGNCETEVLDTAFDVALSEKFLAELDLLQEKTLHGFLVGEI